MSGQQKFYITTPIFYPNGAPHIGHAYTALATDVIARFERLDGKDVFFLTGTDEHGLKMQQTAAAERLTPQALADRNSQVFRDMMAALNVSQDDFIRTTEEGGIKGPGRTGGVRPLGQANAGDTTVEARGLPPADTPTQHVMYVWVDALTNYITAAGFPDEKAPRWRYWPADVHIIGKDIVRFHAVYWPAFLMSAGIAVPERVFAHGFLYNRGEKMSKSVGNVVDPFDLVKAYGVDQVRYFFLREAAFGQDGTYSPEAIANRINADLANDLGNLAQRSLSMIDKNCGGKIPV